MKKLLLALTCFSSIQASADVRGTIRAIGCHLDGNSCYVYLEDSVTIPNTGGCTNNSSLRFSGADSDTNKNTGKIYATLLAAKLSGKRVHFGHAGKLCYNGYTSFRYLSIED